MSDEDTYTCTVCRETFGKGWSDEAADNEYAEEFPEVPATAPRDIVCDDCYKKFMAWHKAPAN